MPLKHFGSTCAFVCTLIVLSACGDQSTKDLTEPVEPRHITAYVGGSDPCEHAGCARPLEPDEALAVNNAIDGIPCDGMSDRLRTLYDSGRIRVYDAADGHDGDIHMYSDDSNNVIHLYIGTVENADKLVKTLRHEYGHEVLGGGTESEAREFETSCDEALET